MSDAWKAQQRERLRMELLRRLAQRPIHLPLNRPPYMQSTAPAESEIIKSADINGGRKCD